MKTKVQVGVLAQNFPHPMELLATVCGLLLLSAVYASAISGTLVSWGGGQARPSSSLTNVAALSTAIDHSLALNGDGTVSAWGYNFDGQCNVPAGLNQVKAVAAGAFFSVALKADGTVVAWGDNQYGQTQVPLDAVNVTAISAGRGHVLALKADRTVEAWGSDIFGQCDVPSGLGNVVAVFANWNYSLALKGDGTVVAWGIDDAGQTDVPSGLSGVSSLSGNMEYCVAVKNDGTVVAWGKAPAVPAGLSGVTAVAAGEDHCVALTSNGSIVVWGADDSGQINVPLSVTQASLIGAGWNYSVALVSSLAAPGPFSITAVNWGSGTFTVSVPTQNNKNYVLQYKNSITDSNWTSLTPVAGTGQTIQLSDSNGGNGSRVYRVQQM